MRLPALALAGLLAACAAPAPSPQQRASDAAPAQRIVSLDYCADQYVLGMVPRSRILAVSPDADANFSYMRTAASGLPRVPPRAEDVLALRPDLVVRSYGGGPGAEAFFARAGVPVLQLAPAEDIAGVRRAIKAAARRLDGGKQGEALAAEMDARLAGIRARPGTAGRNVLYVTPGGVTAGPGTLVHSMITAAGLENFAEQPGWHPLPLERLARETPDVVAAAAFGETGSPPDHWGAARHPVVSRLLRTRPVVRLEGAWTACGGWFLLDAIEALATPGSVR